VKHALIRIGAGMALLTTILVVLVVLVPGRKTLLVEVYELLLGAIAVSALVSSFRTLEPEAWLRSPFERGPEKPEAPPRIAELDRIERLVVLGIATEFDLHYRLGRLLRQLAAEALHARHGIDLDREPDRARPLLGEGLGRIVWPEREPGRHTPGIDPAELAADVGRLERL
jgi:hypothetical protein